MRGGPGTDDPERITFISVTMKRLLMVAYRVDENQISGPGWLDSQRYAIAAKVPAGLTREQVLMMLQDLLAERFHLTIHHERKDFQAYELVVAKGGPKLKPAVEADSAASPATPPPGRYSAANPEPWRLPFEIQYGFYFRLGWRVGHAAGDNGREYPFRRSCRNGQDTD